MDDQWDRDRQPVLNKLLDDILKIKLIYKLYLGSALFVLGFFTLLFATDYPHFILTMVIVTLGEILTFPTIPAVVDNLSTLSEKGKYQGAVSVFAALGRAIGPLAGGLIVDNSSYDMLFTVMIALMGLTTLFVIVVAQFNLVKK